MAYIKETAIVLRKKTLRKGNRWYTLFCKDRGKVDVLARSSASSKSKLAGHLEPGTMCDVMLAPGKAIIHLAGVDTIKSYRNINLELETAILKISALAATNDLIFDEHGSEETFNLLDKLLTDLNNTELRVWQKQRLSDLFTINILSIAGFEPNLSLGHKAKRFSFHTASLIGKELLEDSSIDVDKNLIKLFEFMLNKKVSWEEKRDWLIKVKQSEKAFTSLHNLISKYYLYQVNRELTDIKQIYGS